MPSSARSHWPASASDTAHMRLLMLFLRANSEICAAFARRVREADKTLAEKSGYRISSLTSLTVASLFKATIDS